MSLEDAGRIIAGSKTVHVGNQQPMALVRAAIKAGARALTLIPTVSASMAVDLLIAAGCVEKLYVSYVGFELFGFAPAFRAAAQSGALEVVEADEPFLVLGTRAAAGGMPFVPVDRIYEATDLPALNPMLKKVVDPFTGDEMYAIPPLHADVCILHAQECDVYGNAQCWGGNMQEVDKAMASRFVIVSTERVIPVDRTREAPDKVTVPGHLVHAVVHAPFGAHPMVSARNYEPDAKHIEQYFGAHAKGQVAEYLSTYIHSPGSHAEYISRVGLDQVMALMRNV
jgi:glutaconate CoA-transferase subunit A